MKRFYPLFFLLSLVILSCQDPIPPEDITPDPDAALMEATVNGATFRVTGLQVSGRLDEGQLGIMTLAVAGATLPVNDLVEAIALAIVSTDSTDFAVGEVYTGGVVVGQVGAGEYSLDNDADIDVKALSSQTDVATITITAIDYDQNLVSGTFSFDGVDEDDPNTVYEVRNGKFVNVPFK